MYNLVSDAVKESKVSQHGGTKLVQLIIRYGTTPSRWLLPWKGLIGLTLDQAYLECKQKERDEANEAIQHQGQ